MKSDVVAVDLSAGNVHEVSPVRGIRLSGIQGLLLGDSGYVSRQVHELRRRDLTLIAKPRPEMTDELWVFKKVWAPIYRKRQRVEGFFNVLKNFLLLAFSLSPVHGRPSIEFRDSLAAYGLCKHAS